LDSSGSKPRNPLVSSSSAHTVLGLWKTCRSLHAASIDAHQLGRDSYAPNQFQVQLVFSTAASRAPLMGWWCGSYTTRLWAHDVAGSSRRGGVDDRLLAMLFLMAERRRLWLALEAVRLQFAFPRAFASELSEPWLKCWITASGYPSKHFRELPLVQRRGACWTGGDESVPCSNDPDSSYVHTGASRLLLGDIGWFLRENYYFRGSYNK